MFKCLSILHLADSFDCARLHQIGPCGAHVTQVSQQPQRTIVHWCIDSRYGGAFQGNFCEQHVEFVFMLIGGHAQVVNAHVPTRQYWRVVLDSAAIAQQMCAVVASAAVPAHLYYGSLRSHNLLITCAVLLLAGVAI